MWWGTTVIFTLIFFLLLPILEAFSLQVTMSSSIWSTDELTGEGQGYADATVESSTSGRSSILGSAGEGNQPAEVEGAGEEEEAKI